MGGMNGLGIGLGKMMEGVSGGMVAGKQMQIQDARYQDKRATDEQRYQDDTAFKEDQARFTRGVSTLNTAYNLAASSPNPREIFKAVREKLNPGGGMVDMDFAEGPEGDVELSYPGSAQGPGWKVKGKKRTVAQILDVMEKHPDKHMEVLKKGVELGVVKIEQVPYADPKANGGTGGSGGGPKVSDYIAGIKGVGAKYQVDAAGGLSIGPDGTMSVDPAAFMSGKETAYTAIKKVINEATDPSAKAAAEADLKRIDFWYQQIEGILGAPEAAPAASGAAVSGDGPLTTMMGVSGSGGAGSTLGPVQGDALVEGLGGFRERDVALAMDKYGMSREDVIAELKRRRAAQ